MLDHVFTDTIGALRDAFEDALLERQPGEEHFQSDLLLGDVSWDNSYALPGEGQPPRVCADISCVWPIWSQAAYLGWMSGESYAEPPRIEIKILLRAQCLAGSPEPGGVLSALPTLSPEIGAMPLRRGAPRVEAIYGSGFGNDLSDVDIDDVEYAIDVNYEGVYELDDSALSDGSEIDNHFSVLGGWVASLLVRLGDLNLQHKPTPDH